MADAFYQSLVCFFIPYLVSQRVPSKTQKSWCVMGLSYSKSQTNSTFLRTSWQRLQISRWAHPTQGIRENRTPYAKLHFWVSWKTKSCHYTGLFPLMGKQYRADSWPCLDRDCIVRDSVICLSLLVSDCRSPFSVLYTITIKLSHVCNSHFFRSDYKGFFWGASHGEEAPLGRMTSYTFYPPCFLPWSWEHLF